MSRILIVDDDPDFRALVVATLEARGYQVSESETGRRASAVIATTQPELIIVDGLLPDINGIYWIETRRAAGDQTPILFVSAFWRDLESYRRLTRDLGVVAVLHKPVRPEAIADQVDAAFGRLASTGKPIAPANAEGSQPAEVVSAVRAAFDGALPARIANLLGLIRELDRGAVQATARAGRDAAHQLAGTAGSFGYDGIAAAAAAVEQLMVSAASGQSVPREAWTEATSALREAFASATRARTDDPAPTR